MLFFHHEVVESLLGPCLPLVHSHSLVYPPRGGTPYNGLYGEAPPRKEYLFQASDERVGILPVEVYETEGKSVIWVCERAQRPEQMNLMAL